MNPRHFEFLKKAQFRRADKSDEGNVDKKISKLIAKINRTSDYYTTSSCSGRIVLMVGQEKKQEGLYLFKSHDRLSEKEFTKAVKESVKKHKGLIYLKMESCILHIACKSLNQAQELMNKAKLAGWKKTGIISAGRRVVCEISSTEKLELPIADKGKPLLSGTLGKIIQREANAKLERTWKKIKKLEKAI
ncbi:MAG: tRNA wybutosine-synthesizing 3 family protein [archaeon]